MDIKYMGPKWIQSSWTGCKVLFAFSEPPKFFYGFTSKELHLLLRETWPETLWVRGQCKSDSAETDGKVSTWHSQNKYSVVKCILDYYSNNSKNGK